MANLCLQHLISYSVLGFVILGVSEAGTGLYTGPYFPSPQTRNITIHQNTIAYLPCSVRQLGDKSVSWVRQRDADILTVDRYTFVRDERLTVHYIPDTQTWTLVIKYVQARDAGTYECQISTEPKMSMLVNLNVIVPQVEIIGAVDKYVRKGSTAKLECTVSSTVQLPDYIFWYRSGQRLLEYNHPRISINVTRIQGKIHEKEMIITSVLVITKAMVSDGGNYTCLPSNLHNATTILHVLNDEHPAAMQTGAAILTDPPSPFGILLVVLIAFVFVHVQQDILISRDSSFEQIIAHHKFILSSKPFRSLQAKTEGTHSQLETKGLNKNWFQKSAEGQGTRRIYGTPYCLVSRCRRIDTMTDLHTPYKRKGSVVPDKIYQNTFISTILFQKSLTLKELGQPSMVVHMGSMISFNNSVNRLHKALK